MKISEWMQSSGVGFGTSGARGLVTAMTDAVCFAYTSGYLKYLASLGEFSEGTQVAVAGALRPSTPRILQACIAAIRHMGGVPVFCGFVPTPALCLYAYKNSIPSLMITGSHIPADRNGIKFNRLKGEFLKPDEMGMRNQIVEMPKGWFSPAGALLKLKAGEFPPLVDVIDNYVERYQNFFGNKALEGLKLGIYQHSAVGRDVLVRIVEALGGVAIPLGRSESFVPVDTEAVRQDDIILAKKWTAAGKLDGLLTTDGDSDRPILADHKGNWLRGDVLGILAVRFLKGASVSTPVSSNTALEKLGVVADIRRTCIGSPYVIEAMNMAVAEQIHPVMGYEANGGFLLASDVLRKERVLEALPTRDAILPMVSALVGAHEEGKVLAEHLAELPARYTLSDRLVDIPTLVSQRCLQEFSNAAAAKAQELGFVDMCGSLVKVDKTDGLRMTFSEGDIIHIRPSGNAPELRVYIESHTTKRAEHLLNEVLVKVRKWVL